MAVASISAVGAEPSNALSQMAKAAANTQQTSSTPASSSQQISLGNSIPASAEVESKVSNSGSQPGFVNSVLDGVYSEIDKLSSKVPDAVNNTSPIDTYKSDMASQIESLNPQAEGALKPEKDNAVVALSKTFDHAIFMAMVNQVVSGVSDTSRTLIRQS